MGRPGHYTSKVYLVNRAELLADEPLCHWCRRAPATEADHLVELVRGGTHDRDNLVPACKACNSRRGSQLGNRRRKPRPRRPAQLAPRSANGKKNANGAAFLGRGQGQDPAASRARSPRNGSSAPRRRSTPDDRADPASGRIEPRLVTPTLGGKGYGPAVARWWETNTGSPLMAWQQLVLRGTLSTSRTDGGAERWAHRHALWSVARQNGKTTALEALLGWWLTDHAERVGAQQVTLSSHDLRLTAVVFERVAALLERMGRLEDRGPGRRAVRWSHGRQDLNTANGSQLVVQSSSASAGHGLSPDLVVVDELWKVSEDAVDQGLLPAQRARPNPLMVMTSTAGDDSSTLLKRWREHGLRAIDDGGSPHLWFAEWSPPPGVDPLEERWWRWANPAMGTTITLDTLRAEAQAPNRSAFLRASLNLWVASASGWLEPGLWEALEQPARPIPPGGVVACETSQDGGRWVALVAGRDEVGTGVGVGFVANDEPTFWRQLAQLTKADPKLLVALTPGLDSHAPTELRKRIVVVGFAELRKWTALVRSALAAGDVWHRGEHQLTEQVGRAVAAYMDGGMALSSAKSPGPIELARCLVWAVALVTRPTSRARPAIGVAGHPG